MTKATEIEVQAEETDILDTVKDWAKTVIVAIMVGGETTLYTDDVRAIVEMTTKVRQIHDEEAKAQGNPTVRKQRADSGKVAITEEDAARKAAALIG